MNTVSNDQWAALCEQQHARAMAGDSAAATWCAKHQPAIDAARGWQAYNALHAKFARLSRFYDRLFAAYEAMTATPPDYEALRALWSDPQAKADVMASLDEYDKWTPEHKADFGNAFAELLDAMAEKHGLDTSKLTSPEQAERLLQGYADGDFAETCREIAAELAA
jgi:hypothetical protein